MLASGGDFVGASFAGDGGAIAGECATEEDGGPLRGALMVLDYQPDAARLAAVRRVDLEQGVGNLLGRALGGEHADRAALGANGGRGGRGDLGQCGAGGFYVGGGAGGGVAGAC